MSDVVNAVEVGLAGLVIHLVARGLHYFDGVLAKEQVAGRSVEKKHIVKLSTFLIK